MLAYVSAEVKEVTWCPWVNHPYGQIQRNQATAVTLFRSRDNSRYVK